MSISPLQLSASMFRRMQLVLGRDETLGKIFDRLAEIQGDRRLVEESESGCRYTYNEAALAIAKWAGGIAKQIHPGDRVVLSTPNSYEQFLLCFAVSRAGGVAVPINHQMSEYEVAHVISDCSAVLTLTSVDDIVDAEPLHIAVPADLEAVVALFYTSGTTGKPKGVELTHRSLVGQVLLGLAWPFYLRRDEAVCALPVAHIMGFSLLMMLACAGVPMYFQRRFDPSKTLEAIEQRRSTVFIGVPTMYRMMLEAGAEKRDLTSIRLWVSGADTMPLDLAVSFKKFGASATLPMIGPLGEATFIEGYGMVESGGGMASKISPPLLDFGLGESLGLPFPGYRMKVMGEDGKEVMRGQIGELWIKGPGVLKGYWNAPEATSMALDDDGWLKTGDTVRRSIFGTVSFVGRGKDVIKHGGFSVYAAEVQEVFETHPDVLEAAVIGLPDSRWGEIPAVVVRLSKGTNLESLNLTEWAEEHLAHYKVPKQIVAVEKMPRTGTQKVQKNTLKELFNV